MTRTIDLSGRAALVVGGGGGGIGTEISLALADAGADVGVITFVDEHAADTVARVSERKVRAAAAVVDVTDESALVGAIASIADQLGPITALANVVGGSLADDWHRAREYDLESFDRIMARNLRYAVASCREVAAPLVSEGRPGSIVNISSVAARGTPLLGAYGAAKAGLESFSRTMALEWGPRGIRVNCLACGTVKTPRAGTTDLPEHAAQIPLGRRGDPREIAAAALFLLSDESSYITGHTLMVDGGQSVGGTPGEQLPAFVTNPVVRERFGG